MTIATRRNFYTTRFGWEHLAFMRTLTIYLPRTIIEIRY